MKLGFLWKLFSARFNFKLQHNLSLDYTNPSRFRCILLLYSVFFLLTNIITRIHLRLKVDDRWTSTLLTADLLGFAPRNRLFV